MKWQDIVPVLASVLIIIAVAVLERHSRLFAAVAATMPLTIPLSMWVVYSAHPGDQAAVSQFALGLLFSLLSTLAFAITLFLTARAGFKLAPMLATSYAVWGVGTAILFLLKRWLGLT